MAGEEKCISAVYSLKKPFFQVSYYRSCLYLLSISLSFSFCQSTYVHVIQSTREGTLSSAFELSVTVASLCLAKASRDLLGGAPKQGYFLGEAFFEIFNLVRPTVGVFV
jgi:hypothetical protein